MKRDIEIVTKVEVIIDESKFDDKFMEGFREYFYDFTTIDEHLEHLAQLYLRGIACNDSFIEGYGNASDMGIKFTASGYEAVVMD